MKRLLVLVVILTLSISVNGQRKLTLDECIAIALNKNVSLIKQQNSLEVSKENVKANYGGLLPTLSTGANWGWNYNKYNSTTIDFYGQAVERVSESQSRSYGLSANTGLTLFDGLATWARIYQSEDNLQSAKFSLEKAKQDIIYSTSDYFYTIIAYQELVKVNEETLKYQQKTLEQIVEKNKLGSAAIADVYTYQANVGNAELTLINTKVSLEKAKLNFLNFLALNILESYEYVDPNQIGRAHV